MMKQSAESNTETGRTVLVTGAAGVIGRPVCRELIRRGHRVRAFDRVRADLNAEWIVADLGDVEALREAAVGAEAAIHLAAIPTDADFYEKLLPNNIVGTFNFFLAMNEAGVQRLVVTSSVQVVNHLMAPEKTIRVEEGTAPTNHYGVTKVFAEKMGYVYAHAHNKSVIVVRPGWVPKTLPKNTTKPVDNYLSPRDAGRFFAACVEAKNPPAPGLEVLFALSRSAGCPIYDLEPAKRLIGYEPLDLWPEGMEY